MAVLSTLSNGLTDASAVLARLHSSLLEQSSICQDWMARWHTWPFSTKILASLGALSTLYAARIAYQLIQNKRFERRLRLSDGSPVPVAPGTKWYHRILVGYFIRILTEAPSSVIWQERNLYSAELQGQPKVYLAHSFWGAPVLMVTDPKALYFIFSGRGYGFTKWEFTKRALVTLAGKGSMLVVDGDQHKVHRRLVNPLFNMSNLKRLVPCMEECLEELYGVLDKATTTGNVVDFQELSVALTLNVIGRTALDTEFDALNNTHSPLHSAYNHLLESFSISTFNVLQGFLPFLRHLPIKRNRDIAQARDVTRDQITCIIERIKSDGAMAASSSVPSLMRVLLENQKRQVADEVEGEGGKLTQDEIRDEALTFLVAGHETTSNALSMTLYFLAAYPETQSALYSALADLPDHAPLDDLLRLPALQHVVNEGLRVHSPVFATNRMALADQHVQLSDGRTLFMPKGTLLVVPMQAMHYDPDLFPNPHVFNPDRWKSLRLAGHDDADVSSPTGENVLSPGGTRREVHPMQFMPFLAGSRACIGRNFALMELKLFLAGIVRRYRVRLPEEDVGGDRPKVHYSITARPEVVRLVFEKR